MSFNSTPSSERIQIGFFGKRNSGKSSLINALTNQNLSIVSEIKGTTTDPVQKAMELLPLGPVVIIDTAGYDDEGELGLLRIEKTMQILNKVDIAVLTADATVGLSDEDKDFIKKFEQKNIKYIIVYNKSDLLEFLPPTKPNEIFVSSHLKTNIDKLKELISQIYEKNPQKKELLQDLINKNDTAILVTPIDGAAPKGRLILPQQQVLRSLLDKGAITLVVQADELIQALKICGNSPKIVITDSQVFEKVKDIVPKDILLTSFSIIFARYKGVLDKAVKALNVLPNLNNNDLILISEGCTHHRQCDDIGTVKLPKWIQSYTNKTFNFEFTSGQGFPADLSKYKFIIHCGGCMLNDKEVLSRYESAQAQNIPMTNYGILIAQMNGILKRSLEPFNDIYDLLR